MKNPLKDRRPRARVACCAALLAGLGLAAAASAAPPVVSIEPDAVVASGVSPGGEAVAVWLARRHQDGVTVVENDARTAVDEDGDGTVRWEVADGVPVLAVWTVVDLTSGEWTLASPAGFTRPAMPFPGLGEGPRGDVSRLERPGRFLETLWVRPGAGAWRQVSGDGGTGDDDDAADGVVTLAFNTLEPVGDAGPTPVAVAEGDVVVLIDGETLAAVAKTVDAAALAAAGGAR